MVPEYVTTTELPPWRVAVKHCLVTLTQGWVTVSEVVPNALATSVGPRWQPPALFVANARAWTVVTPGAVVITQGITISAPPAPVSVNGETPAGILSPVAYTLVGPNVPSVGPGQANITVRFVSLHAVLSALPIRILNRTVHPLGVTNVSVDGPTDILQPVQPVGFAALAGIASHTNCNANSQSMIAILFGLLVVFMISLYWRAVSLRFFGVLPPTRPGSITTQNRR